MNKFLIFITICICVVAAKQSFQKTNKISSTNMTLSSKHNNIGDCTCSFGDVCCCPDGWTCCNSDNSCCCQENVVEKHQPISDVIQDLEFDLIKGGVGCACDTSKCSKWECTICYAAIASCSQGCGADVNCIAQCLTQSGLGQCISCVMC